MWIFSFRRRASFEVPNSIERRENPGEADDHDASVGRDAGRPE